MSNTVLSSIVIPLVLAVALALLAGGSRPFREKVGGRFRGPGDRQPMPVPVREEVDLRVPEPHELDESGTDYVDFGAPEREHRS